MKLRKVVENSGSFRTIIPTIYAKKLGLESGDKISFEENEKGEIVIKKIN